MNKEKLKHEDVAAALRATGGIVSAAAARLEAAYGSCTPTTVRNYLRRHQALRDEVDQIRETNLDLAEGVILKGVLENNLTAAIFLLKTLGKERGYIERMEATGKHGAPIPIVISATEAKF